MLGRWNALEGAINNKMNAGEYDKECFKLVLRKLLRGYSGEAESWASQAQAEC
jgi:hypothetical protein